MSLGNDGNQEGLQNLLGLNAASLKFLSSAPDTGTPDLNDDEQGLVTHQKLDESENLSVTDMSAYINDLVEYLRDSFSLGQRILFKLDIERVLRNLSHSIPIGLKLNEAITNSIKYAFNNTHDGVITISLKKHQGRQDVLTIADNGSRLPEGFKNKKVNSLGMNLMQGLG